MTASFKSLLIGITVIAVVSDSMLIPFYPQFFAVVFDIHDAEYVGIYLAAYCFAVMLALPLWARAAKSIPTLTLLVYTQLAAGVLSILCYWASTPLIFWVLSLSMLAFKASYLLVYPLVMSLEDKSRHGGTIGLLSVIVNFGAILGALVGGAVLQWFDPRWAFVIMAVGDFLQTGVCLWLIRIQPKPAKAAVNENEGRVDDGHTLQHPVKYRMNLGMLSRVSLVMLVFYFSAYLIYHFFVQYWQSVSPFDGELVSGLVFAIPALMALMGLVVNHRRAKQVGAFEGVNGALILGIAGLLLQAVDQPWIILVGRCLFGWALFQAVVRLDLMLFELSTPKQYASDFSKVRFSQSLGVLLASYVAGFLNAHYGLSVMFFVAALGFVATIALQLKFFNQEIKSTTSLLPTP